MKIVIIETSLSKKSRSSSLGRVCYGDMKSRVGGEGVVESYTLIDKPLPICDGCGDTFEAENAKFFNSKLRDANGIVIALPIHNYSVASSTKNFIEILEKKSFEDKLVGFLVAAGGGRSYMAVMHLANSMMMDFRSIILPRFVFADFTDFQEGEAVPSGIEERIKGFNGHFIKLAKALM